MWKLYVLILKTLSKSQQAVQGGHAVAAFCFKNPDSQWENGTLVYVKVDKDQMRQMFNTLENCVAFYEPDLGDQMTAFACPAFDERIFRALPLV